MTIAELIARQMQEPSGIIGRFIIGRAMNRTNSDIIAFTVQSLDIDSTDRVLDIGFGGGAAIERMVKLADSGLVVGVETSAAMLKQALKKFDRAINAGRVQIKEGSVTKIPYDDGFFNKVCTVNCIYFWPEPAPVMKEIFRVLKPSGRVVVAVYLKEEFERYPPSRYGFRIYSDTRLQELLEEAGFNEVEIEHRSSKPYTSVLAVGIR